MTTTPPLPGEPDDAREEAKQALEDLYTKPRQDEVGQTAYAAVPPPLASAQQPPEQQFGQPVDQAGGQPAGQPGAQSFGQPYVQSYGQQPGQMQGQVPGAPGQAPGQAPWQQAGQTPGQAPGQYPGQTPGQPQQPYGSGSPYDQSGPYNYPPPPPNGPGYGYGQPMPGAAGMPVGMPPFAGWWSRVWAWLLDNFLVGFALGLIVSWSHSTALDTVTGLIAIAWAIYNAYLAGTTGQSYGKRAAGIRLARLADGKPIGAGYALLRLLLDVVFWWLCLIPGALNYLWPLWDEKHQTWCDKIASSVVVKA